MLHLLYPSALSGHCLFVVSGMESPVVKCRHSCDQEELIDGPSSPAPPVIAGIFQISVKTSQIKSESETAWDSLDCSRNWWQRRAVPTWQLYSDQSWSNDIFTIYRQLSRNICILHHTVQCFSLSVNESSVYPSSLSSFNCCSKNKHGRVSTQRRPGPTKTRSLDTRGLPLWCQHCLIITQYSQYYENEMCKREFPKWCNEGSRD